MYTNIVFVQYLLIFYDYSIYSRMVTLSTRNCHTFSIVFEASKSSKLERWGHGGKSDSGYKGSLTWPFWDGATVTLGSQTHMLHGTEKMYSTYGPMALIYGQWQTKYSSPMKQMGKVDWFLFSK